ncbi:hypothetical protein AB0442_35825 [Kitasatospora sp. NPDC085895]|uniref:hypothetical protein n=1 Tax=Kitasatospora sp. NPDC085895 TaxID=3155057 RepID=UPI003451018E
MPIGPPQSRDQSSGFDLGQQSPTRYGVLGANVALGGIGVRGVARQATGASGKGADVGVTGTATAGPRVPGPSEPGPGVASTNTGGPGVVASGVLGPGVPGTSTQGTGMAGAGAPGSGPKDNSGDGSWVAATSGSGFGTGTCSHEGLVLSAFNGHPKSGGGGIGFGNEPSRGPVIRARSWFGWGVLALSEFNAAVHAQGPKGLIATGSPLGVDIAGGAQADGTMVAAGAARFLLGHPLPPAGSTLAHAFVVSPGKKDVHDGAVSLDDTGRTAVPLPDRCDALNQDFRYQLTTIGAPAHELHISQEIHSNGFAAVRGTPGGRAGRQVTGVRFDRRAQTNPAIPESVKSAEHRGLYLHPAAFDQPPEHGIAARRPRAG